MLNKRSYSYFVISMFFYYKSVIRVPLLIPTTMMWSWPYHYPCHNHSLVEPYQYYDNQGLILCERKPSTNWSRCDHYHWIASLLDSPSLYNQSHSIQILLTSHKTSWFHLVHWEDLLVFVIISENQLDLWIPIIHNRCYQTHWTNQCWPQTEEVRHTCPLKYPFERWLFVPISQLIPGSDLQYSRYISETSSNLGSHPSSNWFI